MANLKICPGCGAEYDAAEAKCPYCGLLNPAGAEASYMKKMHAIRSDLQEMGDDVEEEYARRLKKQTRRIGFIIGGVLVVVLILAGLFFGQTLTYRHKEEVRDREELNFRKSYFDELNRIYETGDDEAVVEYMDFLYDKEGSSALWSWQHYDYYTVYNSYRGVEEAREILTLAESGELDPRATDDYIEILTLYTRCAIEDEKGSFYNLDELRLGKEERERAEAMRADERVYLREDLGLTEKEIDSLCEASWEDESHNFLNHDKFSKAFRPYAEKLLKGN